MTLLKLKHKQERTPHAGCPLLLSSILSVIVGLLQLIVPGASAAERADTVMASILVAGPGELVYQAAGHAAIRLRCPQYGLDNAFTYETSSDKLLQQTLGKAHGRFVRLPIADYLDGYRSEGRSVIEFPVNLTDPQIRTLWKNLDRAADQGYEDDFNIRFNNCNSNVIGMINRVLEPDRIVLHLDSVSSLDNATIQKRYLADESPWSTIILNVALGADADETDSWLTRIVPITMPDYFSTAEIQVPDGSLKPFLAAAPVTLLPQSNGNSRNPVSPVLFFTIVLLLVALLSAFDILGLYPRLVKCADITLLIAQSAMSVLLLLAAVVPSSIAGVWNWFFIPFNPLPAVVWLCCRRTAFCRRFFIGYGFACALFIFARAITSQAGLWSSILSAAMALAVLSHYLFKNKPDRN